MSCGYSMAMLGLASGQLAVKQDRSARENHRSGDPGKVHSGIRSEVGQLFIEINAFCFLSKLSISYPSMLSTQREQGSNELTFSISNIQVMFLVL
ncbi:hypothetical protein NC653_020364 [Populus alba x Populus x berolinensis]|uniref:Uncharacterized protein n=1 Tax=Populus alba x Populus x berolinensis TaxID=444605 RepID=A0AAD6MK89_9ROSI|nr:hypothetical protein NC653_020364 [Populus alba x Populus x berolinensis]